MTTPVLARMTVARLLRGRPSLVLCRDGTPSAPGEMVGKASGACAAASPTDEAGGMVRRPDTRGNGVGRVSHAGSPYPRLALPRIRV